MRSLQSWRYCFAHLVALSLVVGACGSDDSGDPATALATLEEVTTTHAAPITTTGAPERFEGQLAGLTVIDENTFTVELYEADPEFPLQLSFAVFFALPDSALADPAAQNEMPIGNGPFMMAGPWEHNVRIAAVRNPDYQGPDPAKVDSYEWVLHLSPEVAYSETLAGNVDVMAKVPNDFLESATADFGARSKESDRASIHSLQIPAYLERYTREIRQALSMAIDRELLVEQVFGNSASAAHSVIPRVVGGHGDVCDSWNYHPEKARELWDAAGGLDEITVWTNTGHEEWVKAVVDMWGETLGIDTSEVIFEVHKWEDWVSLDWYGKGLTGPFHHGWGQDYPSPLNFLEPTYASYRSIDQGGWNANFYNNPDFDAALAAGKAKVAASGLLQDGLAGYFAAEDILCDDAQTIPIYFPTNAFVHSDNVSNVCVDSFGDVGYTVVEAKNGSVIEYLTEPTELVSTYALESAGFAVLRALNTGLIQFDPCTNLPFNAHARSITSDDGGKTWTLVLNPGWTFHDGTPNDAASYVKTWSYGAAASIDDFRNLVGYDELNPDADEG